MTQFELFSLIYYALDTVWDQNHDHDLGEFLSGANPFLFQDAGSADPSVYADFCSKVKEPVPIDQSYEVAIAYVNALQNASVRSAFAAIEKSDWLQAAEFYLNAPHKK